MASSTMKINLAVDRSRNRVLFADAGSDFVDVLLSFLTLPLSALHFCGTASLGCLPELCDSVNRLRDSKLLKVEACHGALLTPPHTHEFGHCFCDIFVKNQPNLHVDGNLCKCWQAMARLVHVYRNASSAYGTFVRCKERFVISDDWTIKSASTSIMQSLPQNFGSPDAILHGFEEVEVCVGWPEVVSMLKASLSSDTTITDVFLTRGTDGLPGVTVKPSTDRKILHGSNNNSSSGYSPERKIKLFFDIHEKKVMYAECKREFVDLLLRFLTYPLGCVIKNMTDVDGTSHLGNGSFDNLYSSVVELNAAGFITSYDYPVEMLLNPSLCPFREQCYLPSEAVLEPEDQPFFSLAAMSKTTCRDCHPDLVEDRTYVVSDDLLVHQASAMSVAKHWYMRDKANVLEVDVTVAKPEAVALLRAMLTSKTPLTDVFICKLEEGEPPIARSL